MKRGEYVLGVTGGTGDPWAVGFYGEKTTDERHTVLDAEGRPILGRSYRRVSRLTHAQGRYLLDHADEIERSGMKWGAVLRIAKEYCG